MPAGSGWIALTHRAWASRSGDGDSQYGELGLFLRAWRAVQAAKDSRQFLPQILQLRSSRSIDLPAPVSWHGRSRLLDFRFHGRVGRFDVDDGLDECRRLVLVIDADVRHGWLASVVLDNYALPGKACGNPGGHSLEVTDRSFGHVPAACRWPQVERAPPA